MKTIQKQTISFFTFLLIVIVPLGYSDDILDNSLLPKYLLISVSLIVCLVFYFKKLIQIPSKLSLSTVFLLAYLGFSMISIFGTLNPSEAIYETSKILLFAITFFIFTFFLKQTQGKVIRSIVSFSLIAILLSMLFSMKEFFEAIRLREPLSSSVYLIKGLHGHKNLLAAWIMLLMPLAAMGLFIKTKVPKAISYIVLLLALTFVFVLQTRAVFFGLLLGLLVLFLFMYGLKKAKLNQFFIPFLYSFFGLIVLLIFMILFTSVPENFLSSLSLNSSSAQERIILWKKTMGMIKQHSFLGTGGGNWKFLFPNQGLGGLYRAELNDIVFMRPHNDLLWIWSEYGLLSLLAYLGFLFTAISEGIKGMLLKTDYSRVKWMGIAGIFAYLGMSLFDFPMERIEHQIVFAILLAIVVSGSESKFQYAFKHGAQKVLVFLSIVFVGFSLYMGMSRYNAEIQLRKMLTHKDEGNNEMLLDEAQKIDQTFIQADNNAVPISWYEGNAHFNLGKRSEAIMSYNEAMLINPYNFNVLNNAGTGYFLKKDYQTAISYYLQTLKINPSYDDAKLNLASAYINLGQWGIASQWLDQLRIKSSRSEELRQLIENS